MLSIGTCFKYDIPVTTMLPLIKEAGFSHISLGADEKHTGYLDRVKRKEFMEMVADNGLKICSVHTPLDGDIDISSPDNDIAAKTLDVFKRSIDAAEFLGAGMIIFHPIGFSDDTDDIRKEIIVRQVDELLEYLGEREIRIALENLSYPHSIKILDHCFESVQDKRFGFCYDSSHDNLTGDPLKILERYKGRLFKTHISDNYEKEDDHNLPFDGTYPWDDFCRIFAGINYRDVFLLEVEMKPGKFETVSQFLKEAYKRGMKLLDNIEKVKTD